MMPSRKIEGIDRFILIACALIFADIPQAALTVAFLPIGWGYGIVTAIIFGFILNAAFDVRMFGPRMGFKAIVYFLMEMVPGIGAISFLSVGMFVISHFHNKHVDDQEKEMGGAVL